jgi:flagellin
MSAKGLSLRNVASGEITSISTPELANRTIGVIDNALKKVNKQRADLGAYQNRLESVTRAVAIGAENLQASESRIRDTDMAKQMSELVKDQILTQAGTSMLAQANTKSQGVLRLLQQ